MKKHRTIYGFLLTLLISWALPIYAVIYNRTYPSYESALGVAYGFGLGCVIHFVTLFLWVALRRSRLQTLEWVTLLASFGLMVALTTLGDAGTLSKISST